MECVILPLEIGGREILLLKINPSPSYESPYESRAKELDTRSLEEAFELFCQGVADYGPFWDHVLGFWKASLEFPEKLLFLKYETMKEEPVLYVKRLAEFVGRPFLVEEESQGVVDQIIKLCSFEHLSSLEIKKPSQLQEPNATSPKFVVNNPDFFRKGQIGDWKLHFTDEMAKRVDYITEEKIKGSGLTLG